MPPQSLDAPRTPLCSLAGASVRLHANGRSSMSNLGAGMRLLFDASTEMRAIHAIRAKRCWGSTSVSMGSLTACVRQTLPFSPPPLQITNTKMTPSSYIKGTRKWYIVPTSTTHRLRCAGYPRGCVTRVSLPRPPACHVDCFYRDLCCDYVLLHTLYRPDRMSRRDPCRPRRPSSLGRRAAMRARTANHTIYLLHPGRPFSSTSEVLCRSGGSMRATRRPRDWSARASHSVVRRNDAH